MTPRRVAEHTVRRKSAIKIFLNYLTSWDLSGLLKPGLTLRACYRQICKDRGDNYARRNPRNDDKVSEDRLMCDHS